MPNIVTYMSRGNEENHENAQPVSQPGLEREHFLNPSAEHYNDARLFVSCKLFMNEYV
jgi:hypothetical protein